MWVLHKKIGNTYPAILYIAVQKKSVIDESSGQKGSKRKKYTTLNKRVQSTVEKYYTYTDKMKYLRYLVVLQGGSAVKPIED